MFWVKGGGSRRGPTRGGRSLCLFNGHVTRTRNTIQTGHGVLTLHRVRYGEVDLGDLPEGEVRQVPPDSPEGMWAQRLLAAGRPRGEGSDEKRPPREESTE